MTPYLLGTLFSVLAAACWLTLMVLSIRWIRELRRDQVTADADRRIAELLAAHHRGGGSR